MARVQAGEVQLGWREWGEGDVTVVFIHGNLASKDWIELAAPLFPTRPARDRDRLARLR